MREKGGDLRSGINLGEDRGGGAIWIKRISLVLQIEG